ncbi:bifunctional phosphopantothenoylcysteine decarboxylase/phosphopantothenate--cysteine ligase CoaBC [Sediminispirochaeta smaragdinae]|uniref:Coenzyme A biosynthesis bifunctional protein CoaBC n=1 Tax=Sediminispirochaeta smaragdinae (strain DSM 11293 / JCM 15392 / SEBR 4228) TaxID=573413 RepID=E1R681_SEDSS|nr:bifunctional phosphopantothenoylcysteine decarboxylase/phosphopantothenate--cysteine ligase CoaBC [Sediminispirochaeta smaragdinae]ADK80846.1 phosphopantothenoylcysteine decarboxylase/phosphopantothenate/cysteine ligase [Sediminispirochaeta smaragdinae DSM 11293]
MSMNNHPSKDIIGTASDCLSGKRIALGICGSVGAVKSPELARQLMRHGADVYPVMTEAACGIIHPDLMEWATGHETITKLTGKIEHVALAGDVPEKIDLLLIAPSTANTIGKIAAGIDDTTVTTLATTAIGQGIPLLIVPAMHEPMWRHPMVVQNIASLRKLGISVLDPKIEEGKAKIPDPDTIFHAALPLLLQNSAPLSGKHVVVTAGRTVEYIDPVRVITNNASGRMGMAIARTAMLSGARVTVLAGKIGVKPPAGVELIRCDTSESLLAASKRILDKKDVDIYVAAAAVGDWQCDSVSSTKISTHGRKELNLTLTPTPKILDRIKELSPKTYLIAFRALHKVSEEELRKDALARMKKASADMIAVNDVSKEGSGFETETNQLHLFFKDGEEIDLPLSLKDAAARRLLLEAARRLGS